jgi:hypothetical protein
LFPSWCCCFLSKQGNHAHARRHTFPCGANISFPKKRLCLTLWRYCFVCKETLLPIRTCIPGVFVPRYDVVAPRPNKPLLLGQYRPCATIPTSSFLATTSMHPKPLLLGHTAGRYHAKLSPC